MTASELLHGVHRAVDPAARARRGAWVEAMLERFPLLPIDLAAARVRGERSVPDARRGRLHRRSSDGVRDQAEHQRKRGHTDADQPA
ncbi:MAG: hypothetical protein WEF86_14475 [Gemmatimonadota bacterium]